MIGYRVPNKSTRKLSVTETAGRFVRGTQGVSPGLKGLQSFGELTPRERGMHDEGDTSAHENVR
jgi:hypothetical protein